jgi:pyridoxine 5-phosphate synthase
MTTDNNHSTATKIDTALSVNLNKIALLRNSREGNYPCIVEHAQTCIAAGADGITVHPRPDQRHIRPDDVHNLQQLVAPLSNIEFNIEGNPFAGATGSYPGFIELVAETKPDQCTLVPDTDDQLTSDHGFDLTTAAEKLAPIIARLKDLGCRISLFMDPDIEQIKLASQLGVERIELYTGPYAEQFKDKNSRFDALFQRYYDAAVIAHELGLGINAGHDLNLLNLPKFREIPQLAEVSIGHALTVDSIKMGMSVAVKKYKQICQA